MPNVALGAPHFVHMEHLLLPKGKPPRISQLYGSSQSTRQDTSPSSLLHGQFSHSGMVLRLIDLLPIYLCPLLQWWLEPMLLASPVPRTWPPPVLFVKTDVSKDRWGLLVFLMPLNFSQKFPNIRCMSICFWMDYQVAVWCTEHQESSQSAILLSYIEGPHQSCTQLSSSPQSSVPSGSTERLSGCSVLVYWFLME